MRQAKFPATVLPPLIVFTALLVGSAPPTHAEESADNSDAIGNLLDGGSVDLSFRYRFEGVDQDGFSEDAEASTLRSRLTLQSGEYRNFDFFLEFDDVREVLFNDFDAGGGNTPNRSKYPTVADPEGTEVNQAYIDYNGLDNITLRLGRQRVNLDNQRFVGGVGWRQNEQTYDAFSASYSNDNFSAVYAYVDKVRRIFGDDVPAGSHEQDGTHLLNVSGQAGPLGKISGYYYRIDNEDAAATSTATYGARLTGQQAIGEHALRYTAEYARQTDIANNPASFDADYYTLEGGVICGGIDFALGWEVLSGDDSNPGEAFRTPLATLHAFNGWADMFLSTPDGGLDDKYVKLKATPGNAIVQLRYHDFETEDGGHDLGSEIDLQLGYKVNDSLRADFYFATFNGKGPKPDTDKVWLMLTAKL